VADAGGTAGGVVGDGHGHRRLAREFLASALYLDLVLLAGLAVVPAESVPPGIEVALIMLGASAGLLGAHWLAFRLAVQLTTDGRWHDSARQEVLAQLAGGLAVVGFGALPFLLLTGRTALNCSLLALAALPGTAGLVIGRLRGRSWFVSEAMALGALTVTAAVVFLKIGTGH
jgi:hypothetical protein